jgi:lysophospholipase L1-like esterase
MREPYLLAASLLTGLAIPASALPQLSSILPANSKFTKDLNQGSQLKVSEPIIPSFDISLPEFSNQISSNLQGSDTQKVDISLPELNHQVLPKLTELVVKSRYQEVSHTVISGRELYYERLALLKTGRIYTDVDDDNLRPLWEKANKHQLTYEDWKSLLALEAKAVVHGQGTNHLRILVGDSLSLWFPREKLPPGQLWLNQGISGDTSTGVLRRLTVFSATRPDVIYVMVGINDLLKGASNTTILHNHRLILRRLHREHPKAELIVQSILPIRWKTVPNSRIRRINAQLALIARQERAKYLDVHDWFTDSEGKLRSDLTTDGVHLSAEGYDLWRFVLEKNG